MGYRGWKFELGQLEDFGVSPLDPNPGSVLCTLSLPDVRVRDPAAPAPAHQTYVPDTV